MEVTTHGVIESKFLFVSKLLAWFWTPGAQIFVYLYPTNPTDF